MTDAERAALEALVQRPLTADEDAEISAWIANDNDRRDDMVAEVLSRGRTVVGDVSPRAFAAWVARTGLRAAIEDHCAEKTSSLRSIALTLRDVLANDMPISMATADNLSMVGAWVQAGELTSAQRDELIAMATAAAPITLAQVSRALNIAQGRMVF